MLRSFCIIAFTALVIVLCSSSAYCHEAGDHDHIFVGVNPDETIGTGDDNKLWIYGVPDVIELLPTSEYIGDKQIYIAQLDCWHSAEESEHRLDSNNESTMPGWLISLMRISYSDPVNFWLEDEATTLEILASDGAAYAFDAPQWEDEENWYFHNHTEFVALADGAGQTFSATFTVFDTGSTGFAESAQYTLNFITIPEPASIALFGSAMLAVFRARARK
jgi:hypothetical protein